jgi:hypothetical protein
MLWSAVQLGHMLRALLRNRKIILRQWSLNLLSLVAGYTLYYHETKKKHNDSVLLG